MEVLLNFNGIDFGKAHTGESIENVELPLWAESASDCVEVLRNALESDYVSKKLHHWIDLIFGYKQKDSAAFTADNLFFQEAYEDNYQDYNSNKGEAYKLCIAQFGQIPQQIFKEPHPQRNALTVLYKDPKNINSPQVLTNLLSMIKEEGKALKEELDKASKKYDESLKQHYANYKSYEEKCNLRNERIKIEYKEQKEKYKQAISEMQKKNMSLKEDYEQLDQKKEKQYLAIMKNMKETYKKELEKYSSKSQSMAYINELEKKIQKYQQNEKLHQINEKKLLDSNKSLEMKNNELQKKIEEYPERKGKNLSSPQSAQKLFNPK